MDRLLPRKKLGWDIFLNKLDANAHAICAAFIKQAKKDGWPQEEIDIVVEEAKDGDYDHLIQTFMRFCP